MIRLIVKEIDVFPDGNTSVEYKTFDVCIPEIEDFLRKKNGYMNLGHRSIVSGFIKEED